MIQIISITITIISVTSASEALQLRLRTPATLPHTICNSGLEFCRFCMQKKKSLCAEFCSSRDTEEGTRVFWIIIEFTDVLQSIKGMLGKPQPMGGHP